MVLSTEVDRVHIHASIIGPVVGQRQDEFHAGGFSSLDDDVENAQVDVDSSVRVEKLHNGLFSARVVLGQST